MCSHHCQVKTRDMVADIEVKMVVTQPRHPHLLGEDNSRLRRNDIVHKISSTAPYTCEDSNECYPFLLIIARVHLCSLKALGSVSNPSAPTSMPEWWLCYSKVTETGLESVSSHAGLEHSIPSRRN